MRRRELSAGTAKLEINDIIEGRYRITGLLGRGGFGAVYAAEHTGTGQAIAIKVMVVGDGGAPDLGAVRRFYKEAQVTAQLRHPNTVRVFDVGQTSSGALFIAMELLHGDTLEERLASLAAQGEVLGEVAATEMATAVLRSLAEAHGKGLVHRDLKPANIILCELTEDEEPLPKVLDFGIARTQDSSLTGQGTALGTPAYMSPEQCMGAAVDGRSDLYSLGVILYRCVTGRLPFDDRNPLTIMYKHAHAAPPPLAQASGVRLSAGFIAVVERALAKRREDRFSSAKAMREALADLRRQDVTRAYEAATPTASLAAATTAAAVAISAPAHADAPRRGTPGVGAMAPGVAGKNGAAGLDSDVLAGLETAVVSALPAATSTRGADAVAPLAAPPDTAPLAAPPSEPAVHQGGAAYAVEATPGRPASAKRGLLVALLIVGLAGAAGLAWLVAGSTDETAAANAPAGSGLQRAQEGPKLGQKATEPAANAETERPAAQAQAEPKGGGQRERASAQPQAIVASDDATASGEADAGAADSAGAEPPAGASAGAPAAAAADAGGAGGHASAPTPQRAAKRPGRHSSKRASKRSNKRATSRARKRPAQTRPTQPRPAAARPAPVGSHGAAGSAKKHRLATRPPVAPPVKAKPARTPKPKPRPEQQRPEVID